jgi:hypothetical protein
MENGNENTISRDEGEWIIASISGSSLPRDTSDGTFLALPQQPSVFPWMPYHDAIVKS